MLEIPTPRKKKIDTESSYCNNNAKNYHLFLFNSNFCEHNVAFSSLLFSIGHEQFGTWKPNMANFFL